MPITSGMSIPSISGSPAQSPAVTAAEIGVAVLKKAQDARKAEGEALLQLIDAPATPDIGRMISVRA
jgi:hypothetical protein